LRRLNKELSRRTKDGKNWNKTVGKLRRLHERAFNTRQDYLHKFTSSVCRKYGTVCLEDLNVSGMVRNRKLSKHIQDASFSEIRRQFEYKAINGVKLVDRFFPSSKTCSSCGHVQKTPLNVRTFICNSCGVIVDRDLNAAMNIRTFAVGHTGSKKSVVKKALVKPNSLTKLSSGQETRFLNFV
jgi:putative transposase